MSNRDPFEVEDSNGDVIVRGYLKGDGRIESDDIIPEVNHTSYDRRTLQDKISNLLNRNCTEDWRFKEY